MGLSRRKFTREFKLEAVRRLEQREPVAALARALEVNPNLLHRWRQEYRQAPATAFPGQGRCGTAPDRVAQLERKIGQQALEIDFLKGCLQRIEEQRQLQALSPKPLSTPKSKTSEREGSR
jgi:transposase-like protein